MNPFKTKDSNKNQFVSKQITNSITSFSLPNIVHDVVNRKNISFVSQSCFCIIV